MKLSRNWLLPLIIVLLLLPSNFGFGGPEPIPVEDLRVTIVEENDDRGRGLDGAKINHHTEQVKAYLLSVPVEFRLIDDDRPEAAALVAGLREAGIDTRPACVGTQKSGGKRSWAFAFAETAEETIAALKKQGVE